MTLSEYLIAYLGKLNDTLGYTADDFQVVIIDTLADYGVSSESDATDLSKLYALAKVHLWRKILVDVSGDYKFSADGSTFNRDQVYQMAKQNLSIAVADAYKYMPNSKIKVGTFRALRGEDFSYSYYDEDDITDNTL